MEHIFEAKTEEEKQLVQIIKSNPDKNRRKKALQSFKLTENSPFLYTLLMAGLSQKLIQCEK